MPHHLNPGLSDSMPAVLQGVRVVRLGSSLAGDYLCATLRDAGASIVEVGALPLDAGQAEAHKARVIINDLGRRAPVPHGLSFSDLASGNTNLVYCSLVSFPVGGPEGLPELEDDPVMALLGLNRLNGDAPKHEPLRVPSLYGALQAAIYISCALLPHIARRGTAQYIEVSLFSAALNVLGRLLVAFDDPAYRDPLSHGYRLPNAEPRRCADGRWVQPHGMFPNFVRILFQAGGHPEWAEEAAACLYQLPDRAAVDLWDERLDAMFLQHPAAQWEEIINAAGGSCTMCRTQEEWSNEEHAHAAGIFVCDPGTQRRVPGPGLALQANPVPEGFNKHADIAVRKDSLLPLAGIRIVDFCIIIAGPTVGRILAGLGADVIKVDAPNRYINPYLWMDVNRGKRSMVLDLRTADGRDIAARLVERADVVTENFRKGKLDALGLGYDHVVKSRPDIVYASTNAFDRDGPWSQRPGWEHNAQAGTGMQWARSENGVPKQVPFPVNDYATGLYGALGVVLALLRREQTGVGSHVRASLARSATVLQSHRADTASCLQRNTVKCTDGWVTAYCKPDYGSSGDRPFALPEGLPVEPEMQTCAAVLDAFASLGIAATQERSPTGMMSEPWVAAGGQLVRWVHPVHGAMAQGSPHGTVSGYALTEGHPAPEPGTHDREILAELGESLHAEKLFENGTLSEFSAFRGFL